MRLKMTDEVRKSMAETQAELDRAMEDPSFRAEVAAAQAQYDDNLSRFPDLSPRELAFA